MSVTCVVSRRLRPGVPISRRRGGGHPPTSLRDSNGREGRRGYLRGRDGWRHAGGGGRLGQVSRRRRPYQRGVRGGHVGAGAPSDHAQRLRPRRVGGEHRQRLRRRGVRRQAPQERQRRRRRRRRRRRHTGEGVSFIALRCVRTIWSGRRSNGRIIYRTEHLTPNAEYRILGRGESRGKDSPAGRGLFGSHLIHQNFVGAILGDNRC